MSQRVWVFQAEIQDDKIPDTDSISQTLTGNLLAYLEQRELFADVIPGPGNMRSDDLAFRFQYRRYQSGRHVHPAYFPLAFATATLYIWFGGPVWTDHVDIDGRLIVEDASGVELGRFSASKRDSRSGGIYNGDIARTFIVGHRSDVVDELVDQAVEALRKGELR